MQSLAQRRMQKAQRVMTLNLERFRYSVLYSLNGLAKLRFAFCSLEIADRAGLSVNPFRDLNYLVNESVFLMFDYSSVIGKRANTHSLYFCTATL
jgi:hypothetical protein